MKKLILVISIALFLFSCKSKRGIITKRSGHNTKEVEVKKEGENLDNTKTISKVYANNTERYIFTYKEIAQEEMRLYGIPASITMAQGILESASGSGRLSVKGNNHFGIKCHGWTGQKIYHDDDAKQECFRKYKDAKYSFRDHSLFLSERKRYSKLFLLKKDDYRGWAKGLKAAGYATDPKYPYKLIKLIERYNLNAFDKEVLGKSYPDYQAPTIEQRGTYRVIKGDTLYSISKRHNITVKELQKLNGLQSSSLNIGQILVVKSSSKK